MADEVLEIEAETLSAAREQAKAKVAKGSLILSETIVSDGKEQTVRAAADSPSAAFEMARKDVPDGAQILREEEAISSSRKSIDVEGFSEDSAKAAAQRMVDSTARIEALSMKRPGKKGFLGIGRKPGLYQADVFQPLVVSIRFKVKARIRVEIGEIPSTGHCQMCGRRNSPADKSESSVHFFCSSPCRGNYFKASIGSVLFGPGTSIVNASGQDLSGIIASGRASAAQAAAHCWSCGVSIPMSKDICGTCGNNQKIEL